MNYLKKYISGRARECIEEYFLYTSDSSYEETKALLDKRSGDMFILQNAFREKLEKFLKIAPRDHAGLRRYADLLRQCLSASRVTPSMSSLNGIHENKRMQEKLPEWLVRRWARIIATYKSRSGFPSFEVFADFVAAEAKIACDFCVLTTSEKTNKDSKTAQQRRQSFATTGSQMCSKTDKSGEQPKINTTKSTSEAKRPKKRWPCVLCSGEHRLDNWIR